MAGDQKVRNGCASVALVLGWSTRPAKTKSGDTSKISCRFCFQRWCKYKLYVIQLCPVRTVRCVFFDLLQEFASTTWTEHRSWKETQKNEEKEGGEGFYLNWEVKQANAL